MKATEKADRVGTIYKALDGSVTKIKSVRFPIETEALIKAAQDHFNIDSFTDCLLQLVETGLRKLQTEDEAFNRLIEHAIGTQPDPEPRRTVYGQKVNTTADKNKREAQWAYMKEHAQFLDREDFIAEGISEDVVDKFLNNY